MYRSWGCDVLKQLELNIDTSNQPNIMIEQIAHNLPYRIHECMANIPHLVRFSFKTSTIHGSVMFFLAFSMDLSCVPGTGRSSDLSLETCLF